MMKTLKAIVFREWREILCGGSWRTLAGCAAAAWFGSFLLSLGSVSQTEWTRGSFGAEGRLFLWWIGVVLFSFAAGGRARRECGAPALDPLFTAPVLPRTLVFGNFLAVFSWLLLYAFLVLPAFFLPEFSSPMFSGATAAVLLCRMLLLCGIGAAVSQITSGRGGNGLASLLVLGLFFMGNALLLTENFTKAAVQAAAPYGALLLFAVLLFLLGTASALRTPATMDRWGAVKLLLLLLGLWLPELTPDRAVGEAALTALFKGAPCLCGFLLLWLAALERLSPARRTWQAARKARWLYALYPLWGGSGMTFLLALVLFGTAAWCEGGEWLSRHGNFAPLFFYALLAASIRGFVPENPWKILFVTYGAGCVVGLVGYFGQWPEIMRCCPLLWDNAARAFDRLYGVFAALDAALLLLLIAFPWQKAGRAD